MNDAEATVMTSRDSKEAVVMSFDHYSSLMETVHLLCSPANIKHLDKSIKQYKSGKVTQHHLLDE